MVAEAGNFFVVIPFMLTAVAALLVIWYAMRHERKGPSVPNLTARRKHPLRHLQVELNKAKKTGNDKAAPKPGEEAQEIEKARQRRDRGDGPGLRRLK